MTREEMIEQLCDEIVAKEPIKSNFVYCLFCFKEAPRDTGMDGIHHLDNCPWLLAKQLKEMEA